MRKGVVLLLFLALFLLPVVNFTPYEGAPTIVERPNMQEDFIMSVDGAESPASLTSFSSTLENDVLFYPDPILNSTPHVGDDGEDDWADSQVKDGVPTWDVVGPAAPSREKIEFIHPDPNLSVEGFDYVIYTNASFLAYFYVWNGTDWVNYDSLGPAGEWNNGTVWGSVLDGNNVTVSFWVNIAGYVYCDYLAIKWHYMTLSSSSHFGESFASVSDWTTDDTSISSDGDLGTITENGAGNTGRAYSSFSSTNFFEYYYEFRIESMTADTAQLEFYDGSDYNTLKTFTAAGTFKGLISNTDAETMQRIGFLVGSEGGTVLPDYLRISRSNESGFSHDGSTTTGTEAVAGYGGTISSDGDMLSLTAGVDPARFNIYIDNTATAAKLDPDDYPFLDITYDAGDVGKKVSIIVYTTTALVLVSYTSIPAVTVRYNLRALTGDDIAYFLFYVYASNTVHIDYIKAYGIANWTYSGSAVTTDDYLYVTSDILYSNIDTGYIEANHDPALSVTATYSIWNLTTGSTTPQFSDYVSSWATYSSETRGPLQSGTVTDIKLKFSADGDISAITFIEDSTSPIVVRSSANPTIPADDEAVTLSAVIEDTIEVYKVYFDAIVYPAGFSDSAYYATEQSDNLWTYDFSTLDAGYYCFKIQATDGANTNSLTEYAYVELTVREAAIIIQEITLIGAGQDFTMMTFSARINRDSSYTIYEESASSSEAATYTGSVTSPSFNLAWEKLPVDDLNVNFTITFVSGALTENYTSQYQIAQVVFDVVLSDKTVTFDWVCLEGESTKAASYAVYDINNVLRSSGTIPEGSFALSFEIWNKKSLTETFYGVKFTNSSSTDWINGTYYPDNPEEYKGGGVVTISPWWQDPITWILIAGGFALVMILTSGRKEGDLPNAPRGLK